MESNTLNLALKYLNSRDRTTYEIKKYLTSRGIPQEEIQECLQWLSETGLIDDVDYCERYVLYGLEKGRGPMRLERELSNKGISSETVRPALEAHFGLEGEERAAIAYVRKLLRQAGYAEFAGMTSAEDSEKAGLAEEDALPRIDEKELARIGRRLASQGFHSHVIYEILGKLRRNR